MIKKITIIGGGTAGWLTALFCENKIKNAEITLIESSEIGILGAGEGTTPHFISFVNDLGITIPDIIKHAKGTIKNGILFTNWNGDNQSFFHPFYDEGNLITNTYFLGKKIHEGNNLDALVPSSFASRLKKAKIKYDANTDMYRVCPPAGIGLHFDARLLASFLKKVGISRGIRVIDGIVKSIEADQDNYINGIELESGEKLTTDFVFDCTGFKRLIVGKYYKSEWVSYSESIPNNRAIPFFLPNDDTIPPYTEAIAMNYGWVWKIPVQGRYGCGYVFDSRKATDEEIKKEIINKYGNVDFPTVFSFEPGCYKEIWKGNCLALGLSSGFIEPLEATSIWTTIISLNHFFDNIDGAIKRNQACISNYNQFMFDFNDQLLAFIYYHYITKNKSTTYWEHFKRDNKPPGYYKKLEKFASHINLEFLGLAMPGTFGLGSILTVGAGNKFFSKESAEALLVKSEIDGTKVHSVRDYSVNTGALVYNCSQYIDHTDYIAKVSKFK